MKTLEQPTAPSIKSRPIYQWPDRLPDAGDYLFVIEPCGRETLSELLREQAHERVRILLHHEGNEASSTGADLGPRRTEPAIWKRFEPKLLETLKESTVGCRLVVIGSEAFLWDVRGFAVAHGLVDEEILLYPMAGQGRRVFCAHCRTFTEGVHVSPVACTGCGCYLEVRDHFSRRLGAYMGVRVDAEEPGAVPQQEELN
ncbi:dimethylamine monooxygenase subunit DmmA family protein [Halomonas sp. THAF5a]|uniref:dimethylamine monooxygenase subunit DmmA family protein n=1 Tax=Halomonas sp. THAF5a TaxID=2587844 RepID=UPI001268E3DB|nr:dimethylamine monooxygenase subunit DmmA family protein [Halomonas sp. THAF5a]